MAPGLPPHEFFPDGREPTSIAFLSTPGTERLYSGVTNSTASAAVTACLKLLTAAVGSVSRS